MVSMMVLGPASLGAVVAATLRAQKL